MKAYILKGDPKEVDKVIRENRIRADRGVITITPVEPDMVLDADQVETLREHAEAMGESARQMAASNIALADLTMIVVGIAADNDAEFPDELVAALAEFGITVPKTDESAEKPEDSVPENEVIPEQETESVPNTPTPMTDDKTLDVADMTEVNLDDVKDTPETDVKAAPAAVPKKTRSKKSE